MRVYRYYSTKSYSSDETILSFTAAANKPITILAVTVTNESLAGDTNEEMVEMVIRRGATVGSGGAAFVAADDFERHDTGDAALSATGRDNDTTIASSGKVMHAEAFNNRVGWFYKPIPEERIWFHNGDGIGAITLETTSPTAAILHIVIVLGEGVGA